MPDSDRSNLAEALQRLVDRRASEKEVQLLQDAIGSGKLACAGGTRSIAILGDATDAQISTGDTYILPPEAINLLFPKTYQPPEPPQRGELPAPGGPPPGYRLPFNRHQVFTGREQDLLDLAGDLLYPQDGPGEAVGVVAPLIALSSGGDLFCPRFAAAFPARTAIL